MAEGGNDNKLVIGNKELVASYWSGNDLNESTVELEIDAHHTFYDRDWGTAEPITGTYDLKRDEAEKLYYFLGQKFGFGATAG